MVQFGQTRIAAITLSAATLSLICCSVVALSIRLDPRGSKSYHLILVQSLLRADIGLALSIVIYFAVQFHVSGDNLERFCKVYLPFLVYFFLVSSGWTVMLALRFRSSQNVAAQLNKPPVPMWAVWAIPTIPAIAMMIMSNIRTDVTDARTNSQDTNQSCQFNHSSAGGILVDIICFQAPLIAIMFLNIYTYMKGLLALHNAPHSVIARQMKRAGGYLMVLLVVWVPNISYNLLVICDDTNEPYDNFLVLTIMLSALQGFLNTCVYVYSNRTMMRWLKTNLCCLRLTGRLVSRPSSNRLSLDRTVENGFTADGLHKGSQGTRGVEGSETESELDELEDDSQWLAAATSFSAPRGARRNPNKDLEENVPDTRLEDANHVVNVLITGTDNGTGAGNSNRGSDNHTSTGSDVSNSRRSVVSLQNNSRSILIGERSSKNITKKKAGYYPDVDSEKFVRFGTTETRTISERTSERASTRGDSEIELS